MRLPINFLSRIAPVVVLIPLAACSTTGEPNMNPTVPTFQTTVAPEPVVHPPVNPALAQPCISAASSKYYLSENNITATDVESAGGGVNHVRLKVDIRDAMCTVTDKGKVRSVVDTMPKSADQVAAEEAAAQKAAANPAPAPVKKAKKKNT